MVQEANELIYIFLAIPLTSPTVGTIKKRNVDKKCPLRSNQVTLFAVNGICSGLFFGKKKLDIRTKEKNQP